MSSTSGWSGLLTSVCGGNCLQARQVFPFALPSGAGSIEAIFDPYNRRLKLYDADPATVAAVPTFPRWFADPDPEAPVTKVTVYARPGRDAAWEQQGFTREAAILGYFSDGSRADLWARYADPQRAVDPLAEEHQQTVAVARAKTPVEPKLAEEFVCAAVGPDEIGELTVLLNAVFSDYPTPLTEAHLRQVVENRANHFLMVRDSQGRPVAAASAELDHRRLAAEMTDCATLPEMRGKGLMACILAELERQLPPLFGIKDCYTIARSDEVGMNCVFAKLGYTYTGCLINNCRMPNGWESMNVWCKTLI